MKTRAEELIEGMARYMGEGRYVDGNFLREYDVSASETDVFSMAAIILRGYLRLSHKEQVSITLLGCGVDIRTVQIASDVISLKEIRAELA